MQARKKSIPLETFNRMFGGVMVGKKFDTYDGLISSEIPWRASAIEATEAIEKNKQSVDWHKK